MTEKAEDPAERIADDRAAEVADVHLLGDVRRRVVDDDPASVSGLWDREPRIGRHLGERALEQRPVECEVEEPRTRDLDT